MLHFILLTLLSVFLSELIVRMFFSRPENELRSSALPSQRRCNQPQANQDDAAPLITVNTWGNNPCDTGNQTATGTSCTNSHTETTIISTCDTSPMSCG